MMPLTRRALPYLRKALLFDLKEGKLLGSMFSLTKGKGKTSRHRSSSADSGQKGARGASIPG